MLIPNPKWYEEQGELTLACAISADAELVFGLKAFKRIVKKIFGVSLADGEGGILVKHDTALEEEEYKIDGATVYAGTLIGMKNGLASLLQLIQKADCERIILTKAKVEDKPDKDFRAFFADLARKWHDFDVLLGYVDLCYLNKIKYLQLHLVDDQGWTMPLRTFPYAATKGACYTHAEIAYLVEYAHEAAVEIIPECECVGHSRELIKNCPEEFGNEYDGPMNEKIMCVGKPKIWNNVRALLGEFAEVFKYSRYIHIGCDEALHTNWTACHYCRDYMARQGIETTTELYAHFVAKVVDICLSLGRTPLLWEGFHKE
ncbi:MAG: family 20 glycosylhydrolase, partial [Clostridia bacterium]|nr:family 20 glycosylhydrolase [Clostridia bacterium]